MIKVVWLSSQQKKKSARRKIFFFFFARQTARGERVLYGGTRRNKTSRAIFTWLARDQHQLIYIMKKIVEKREKVIFQEANSSIPLAPQLACRLSYVQLHAPKYLRRSQQYFFFTQNRLKVFNSLASLSRRRLGLFFSLSLAHKAKTHTQDAAVASYILHSHCSSVRNVCGDRVSRARWPQMKYKLIGLVRSCLLFKLIRNEKKIPFHLNSFFFFRLARSSYQLTRQLIVCCLNGSIKRNTKESLLPVEKLVLEMKIAMHTLFRYCHLLISDRERFELIFCSFLKIFFIVSKKVIFFS